VSESSVCADAGAEGTAVATTAPATKERSL
jgi:hypothetical protein